MSSPFYYGLYAILLLLLHLIAAHLNSFVTLDTPVLAT
jgi:hypothetical protein